MPSLINTRNPTVINNNIQRTQINLNPQILIPNSRIDKIIKDILFKDAFRTYVQDPNNRKEMFFRINHGYSSKSWLNIKQKCFIAEIFRLIAQRFCLTYVAIKMSF